jgi:UDP-N-acetylglucosamine 1-carboxyvinyltransferase
MGAFEITGGKRLRGELIPQGAKNEALQIISATLLTADKVVIHNIPDILDVNNLISLLKDLGVKVEKLKAESYSFQADTIDLKVLASPDFQKKSASLRGSIMMVGPLLARYGHAYIARPGGDKIGRRRLDTHFFRV